MKKLICTLFALALCASLAACGGGDEPAETTNSNDEQASTSKAENTDNEPEQRPASEGLQFMLNDAGDGYSVIGIGNCLDTDIVIPATYEGKPVTEIGEVAFRDCATIASVTIPDGVTMIADSAFSYCIRLKSVTIPDSVTSIGDWAFSGCDDLTEIHISDLKAWCNGGFGRSFSNGYTLYLNNKTITDLIIPDGVTKIGTFRGCTSLTSVIIPDGVTSIENYAFEGCTGLTSIAIPDGVTSIGECTFSGCTSLTSVIIPDSVTSIGDESFNGCTNLTSVTVGKGVASIGTGAFGKCEKVDEVHISDIEAWLKIKYRGGYAEAIDSYSSNNPLQYGATLYLNGTEVTNVVFPDSITSIDKGTLCGLETITLNQSLANSGIQDCYLGTVKHIIIPDGVTSIGDYAFDSCEGLTSVTIPASVTSVGEWAFLGCSDLTEIYISDLEAWCNIDSEYSCLTDGYTLYLNGKALTDLVIPDGVTSIGKSAFSGCTGLTSITIPDSVTSIGDCAFLVCENLTSITIPDSVTSIGKSAFSGCTGLKSFTISDSVRSIGDYAFYGIDTVTLSKIIFDSENWSSNIVSGVANVVIPDGVTSIGDNAFEDCEALVNITIPDSVTSIGVQAFSGCSGLTSITFPDSVTSIERFAFCYCRSLTSIIIPDSVASILTCAFDCCTGLTSIYCEADSLPLEWDTSWMGPYTNATVYWGGEWEYVDGVPTAK